MVENKNTVKIVIAIVSVAVAVCLIAIAYGQKLSDALGGSAVSMEYEDKLFDTEEIISITIKMDENERDEMLKNASSEEYYSCDVVINGTTIHNVGIRPKGNTSLSSIAMDPDTDRFSFKLEFDHFVEGQTCYGLDKLILNNNYADATNMKEAVIYDMFEYLGADASLYNYATISLNGEYKGVYLALEGVEKSFMLRNFGTQDGELYKPDPMEMGGGQKSASSGQGGPGGMKPPEGMEMPEGFEPPEGMEPPSGDFPGGDFDPEKMPDMGEMPDAGSEESEASGKSGNRTGGGGGGPMMGGNGANLNYTDDDLDSYSSIWDGALSGTSDADHRRVVTALKNISEGTDLEEYLDVDNILKYMAVHTFSVNQDSLSGNMAHNYYLYEYEGKLNMFPWDYNLSFGGMGMGGSDSSEMINDAIDTPFSGTEFFDALLENEEYRSIYHEYLRKLCEEYIDGGRFDEVYSRIRSQIDEPVRTDPTAFYTYDEYQAAAETLYDTVFLRAQSIEGQLSGTIPSTDEGQRDDSSALIDASNIDTSVMGSFNMGGVSKENEGKRRGGRPRGGQRPNMEFPGAGASDGTALMNTDMLKNLVIYGICFAGMIISLLIMKKVRRRF